MRPKDSHESNQRNPNLKKAYLELMGKIILMGLILLVAFGYVFLLTQVKGMEMYPNLKDGDLILAFRKHKNYEKNDVIVYEEDGVKRIGRIIAFEGDIITISEQGEVKVNGTIQIKHTVYLTDPKEHLDYPYTVAQNHYFVLGDFRTQATDSRDFGAIAKTNIVGKVITLLRRQGL